MRLTRVTLSNVRNYARLELEPAPGLNLFVGANAQGKSNLLEAIALLATGKSFRTSRELEVVREGEVEATLGARAEAAAGEIALQCAIAVRARATRKLYAVNGRHVKYASYLGRVRTVAFTPDHLFLVGGPPQARRSLLNAALSQESPAYYAALVAYGRALAQKAAVLKGAEVDETLLEIYDERLVEAGTRIVIARRRFVEALAERASAVYRRLAERGGEELRPLYAPDVGGEAGTEPDVAAAFLARLRQARAGERLRRACLVGPHRDDLRLLLDGRPLSAYGSQGQRRSAVLALKVAEYGVLRERSGESPLLLLDDVLSELDAVRRERFLEELGAVEQAFITAVAAPRTLVPARAWTIDAGALRPEEAA